MADELDRLLTLADHGDDSDAVRRWFSAVDASYDDDGAVAGGWDEFATRFRTQAAAFDPSLVDTFLTGAGEITDPLDVVARFHRDVGAERAPDAYRDARARTAAPQEPGRIDFATFLSRNDEYWQESWPVSQDWFVYHAAANGFSDEVASFVLHSTGEELGDALRAFGAEPVAPAQPATAEPEGTPAPTREAAAAAAMALGWRAADTLRARFPDIGITNGHVARTVDREVLPGRQVPAAPGDVDGEFQAWLDEHLGAQVRYLLAIEPEVTTSFRAAFGDATDTRDWLESTAAPSDAAVGDRVPAAEPAEVADRVQDSLTDQKFDQLTPERRRQLAAEVLRDLQGAAAT